MSESDTPADRAYHDELGVVEGQSGDVFVRASGEPELILGREEALQLAGQLIRTVDGGFEEAHNDGEVRFADMALTLHLLPDGVTDEPVALDQYEWLDPGAWCWYNNDDDAVLEFQFGPRDGFEIGDGGVQ